MRDPATVDRALAGVDAVCHQAAMVGLGVDVQDMPDYAGTNDLGTAVLLAAMARAGVGRLVLASSMVVYGEGALRLPRARHRARRAPAAGRPRRRPVRAALPGVRRGSSRWGPVGEDAPADPRNVYAATKLAQEHLAAAWAAATGGRALALRYHNVYGPRMPRDTPYAGVAAIFRCALEAGRAPRVFEDGGQRRDFVHVADVAARQPAGARPHRPARARSAGLQRRQRDAAHGRRHGRARSPTRSAAPRRWSPASTGVGDVRHVVASPARAREELGFAARVAFAEGMRAFATAPLRPAPDPSGGEPGTESRG